MSEPYAKALGLSRLLLKLWRVLNIGLAIAVALAFVATFVFAPALRDYYAVRPPMDADILIPTLRIMMLLGLPVFALLHLLLTRLLAMVETVRAGDPFVADNAVRLKAIAWCLLVLQLFDLAFGALSAVLRSGGARTDEWKLSLAGWVAVALLFVLARVFEQGARMRDELESMI